MSLIRKINNSFLRNGWDDFSLFDEFNNFKEMQKIFGDSNFSMSTEYDVLNGKNIIDIKMNVDNEHFFTFKDALTELKEEMKDNVLIKLNGEEILPLADITPEEIKDDEPIYDIDLGHEDGDYITHEEFVKRYNLFKSDYKMAFNRLNKCMSEHTKKDLEKKIKLLELQCIKHNIDFATLKKETIEEIKPNDGFINNNIIGKVSDAIVNVVKNHDFSNEYNKQRKDLKEHLAKSKVLIDKLCKSDYNSKPIKLNQFSLEIPNWDVFDPREVYSVGANTYELRVKLTPYNFRFHNIKEGTNVGDIKFHVLDDNGDIIDTLNYKNMVISYSYNYTRFCKCEKDDEVYIHEIVFIEENKYKEINKKVLDCGDIGCCEPF